ncbi:MAG TPA: hypothetical protein VFZ68_00020 [Acidimicrobiales bacterium]
MPTSSAKPARLLRYRNHGLEQVEEWEPAVGHLETALSGLRDALAGLDLPDDCTVRGAALYHEKWFDSLTRAQRHLDEWVGDVANGFLRAEGIDASRYDIDDNLNRSMTVDDAEIVVGFADMFASEAQAREDARALAAILGETGLIHPYDLAGHPDLLEEMAARYPELRDILARTVRFADDEAYAAELVNTLGPRDVRTMVDLTNTFGLAHDRGLIEDDAYAGYVVPLATILSTADRSGRMDDSVRDAIFDMDPSDEPPIEGGSPEHYAGELADMRYRTLALLVTAGDFSPQTTADMAYEIIHNGPSHPQFYDYSGFTDPVFLDGHRDLASNEYAAIAALAEDDHAANIFFQMDRDDHPGELENLYLMNTTGGTIGAEVAAERLGLPVDEVAGWINEEMADAMRGGILEHPLATGTTYDPETIDLVTKTIEAAGWEHMETSAPVREALAVISAPYTTDIAITAAGEDSLPETRLPDLDQGEIVRFMEEVSKSHEGRVALAQNAAALVRAQVLDAAPDIVNSNLANTAFGNGSRLSLHYISDMGEAWHNVQVDWINQREALVAGWRSVTDPVVDLVSGKVVESIPVVGTAADLPLISNVVDGITGSIHDGINDAVYGNLVPEPELESMQTWAAAVGSEVRTAIAAGLWDAPETRQHYLGEAAQHARSDEAWAAANVDGTVTFEEFRDLPVVQNAINTYGQGIITGFQDDMMFGDALKLEQ